MGAIPSWAVRGAKVVCVEADFDLAFNKINDPSGLMSFPALGEVYTIREVRVRYVTEFDGGEVLVGLLLNEVLNPVAVGGSATGEEPGFDVLCFRPLVEAAHEAEIEARLYHKKGLHHTTRKRVNA